MNRSPATAACIALLLSGGAALAEPPRAQTALATDLMCAADEEEARAALHAVAEAARGPLQRYTQGVEVRAVSVDALLQGLARVHRVYPSLQTAVDEIVLTWNYCDVFFGDEGWDLSWIDGQLARTRARVPRRGYAGFRSWGFMPAEGGVRVVPDLLLNNPLGRGQREWFIGAAVLEQCFPHPITGRTTFDEAPPGWLPPGVHSIPRVPPGQSGGAEEEWSGACPARPPAQQPRATTAQGSTPSPARTTTAARVPVDRPRGSVPFVIIAPITSGGAIGPLQAVIPVEPGHGFSGNFRTTAPLAGVAPSVGASVGWAPAESMFIRFGIDERLGQTPVALPTYSWGFGYNKPSPGTISAEVNNWAVPINKFNGDAIALSLGYKFVLPEVLATYLGAGVDVTMPFVGVPTLGVSLSGRPYGNFFLMYGMRFSPFASPPTITWSYGFGYSDWHPYTVALQYNNWGTNLAFEPNFVKNGSITLSWSWAL